MTRIKPIRMLLLLLALVLLGVRPASAHVPGIEPDSGGSTVIGGPNASRAIYGYLDSGEEHDEYVFTVGESVTRTVGLIVPAYPEHTGFRPTLVITPEDGEPIEVPDPQREEREAKFEPFSLTRFWMGGEREVSFEANTRYALRVEPGAGEATGRYVLVFSGPERFEAGDVAGTFRQLPEIWFGTYGGAPFRWNWLALIPILVSAAALAFIVFGLWRLFMRLRAGNVR